MKKKLKERKKHTTNLMEKERNLLKRRKGLKLNENKSINVYSVCLYPINVRTAEPNLMGGQKLDFLPEKKVFFFKPSKRLALQWRRNNSGLKSTGNIMQGNGKPRRIEYKEGAIGFPYTLPWRFWTAEELVFA